jgi:hypothetical protein
VLCLGIGGGGDVVGALGVSELARALGTEATLGGVTWERPVVDPLPGPRRLDELSDGQPLNRAVALAGPETAGPGGFHFAESHMARVLGRPTVLVDPNPGPTAVGGALAEAASRLGCDRVVLVDVGGDVLGHGHEPGLASPLCDAVMLAAAEPLVRAGVPVVAAVFGPGCDGELTPDEVMARISELAAAGGLAGAWGITPQAAGRLREAVAAVPTEASAQALRCFDGERGRTTIRDGRRPVTLSAVGAVTFFFDPLVAIGSTAPLARAVCGAASLSEANRRLRELGVETELDRETAAAAR